MHLKFSATKNSQKGSMLTSAIFIIVFMAIILAGVMRLINIGGINTAYEVIGLRALQAAHTGIEVGLSRYYPLTTSSSTNCTAVTTSSVSLPSTYGMSDCSVSLTCSTRDNVIDGSRDIIELTSTGTCSSGDFTTSRQLTIEAIEL